MIIYGIDLEDPTLQALIKDNYDKLESLDAESIHMLIAAGHEVAVEDYRAYENDRSRGGWKALNFMIDHGICSDVHDFFGRLFNAEMALRVPEYSSVEETVADSRQLLPKLREELLTGRYRPGDVRRVWIPKPGGGQRGLGIPNVVDRWVQQAVHQTLDDFMGRSKPFR